MKPLFILAPPRSFTSVICAMIGQHPEMYGLPETNLFISETCDEFLGYTRRRPGFRHGLVRAVAELGLGAQTLADVRAAQRYLETLGHISTARLFADLDTWASPRRLVEKSPAYVYSSETLARIRSSCEDAYYLHLTRHPRDTCQSICRLRNQVRGVLDTSELLDRWKPREPKSTPLFSPDNPESMWLSPHRNILKFLETIPESRKKRLRGEAFLADPEPHLEELAHWLDIRSDAAAIDAMTHPERSPFACFGPPTASYGNDPSFLASPTLRPYNTGANAPVESSAEDIPVALTDGMKALAAELGYQE